MSGTSDRDEVLMDQIKADLRDRRTFEARMSAGDADGIPHLRSLVRRAGRLLGWKVRTFVTEPSDDGSLLVIVAVIESTPLHEQLMTIRANKKLRAAMESWSLRGTDG